MILTIHGEIVINIYGKKQTVTSLKVTLIELNFASSKIQVKQREASKLKVNMRHVKNLGTALTSRRLDVVLKRWDGRLQSQPGPKLFLILQ